MKKIKEVNEINETKEINKLEPKARVFYGRLIPYIVVGAVMGAVIGIMLAPGSGKDTRRRLSDWVDKNKEKKAEQFNAKKKQVEEVLAAGREKFKNKFQPLKDKLVA